MVISSMFIVNMQLFNFREFLIEISWMIYSYVIAPYNEYPLLLGLLLKLLNGELAWSTRREVLKVASGLP